MKRKQWILTIAYILVTCLPVCGQTRSHRNRIAKLDATRYDSLLRDEPMADAIWVSTNGDGTSTGSWSTGAVPGNGDNAIFNGSSDVGWTTGLTLSGHPTFIVTDDNKAQIGLPGNGITVTGANLGKSIFKGDGNIYIKTMTLFDVVVDMNAGLFECGTGSSDSVKFDHVIIKDGNVKIGSRCSDLGNSYDYIYIQSSRGLVEIDAGDTGFTMWTSFKLIDGLVSNDRAFNLDTNNLATQRLIVAGGELDMTGLLSDRMMVNVLNGGTLIYHPNSDPSGEVPIFLIDGLLDIRKSKFAITKDQLLIGRNGEVLGSGLTPSGSFTDIDLRQDLP